MKETVFCLLILGAEFGTVFCLYFKLWIIKSVDCCNKKVCPTSISNKIVPGICFCNNEWWGTEVNIN